VTLAKIALIILRLNKLTWLKNKLDSHQNQQYYLQCGIYTICKVTVAGNKRYELYKRQNGIAECVGRGKLDELKQIAKEKQNESM